MVAAVKKCSVCLDNNFFIAVSVVGCKGLIDVLHSLGVNCCEILTYHYTISMLLHRENIIICLTNTV